MNSTWVEIDGSLGEGGGQILRSALTLSLLTSRPFHVRNIRAGRAKPGLQAQHLMSVRAAATIGQAQMRGASLGSTELHFEPGEVRAGQYHFAIGTAGATGLVLHTIYLPLTLASGVSTVTIEGGTHVKASPCFHFLDITWRGYLHLLGIQVQLQMPRPGFYPRGGGLLQAQIEPGPRPKPIHLTTLQPPSTVTGFSAVAGLPAHIAHRQADRARNRLRALGWQATLTEENWALVLNTQPVPTLFFSLGERGKPAERVADETVGQMAKFVQSGPAGVDGHSADQLLLPLVLAEGESTLAVAEITQHLLTNAAIIEAFLPRTIECTGKQGKPGTVRIV